VTPDLGGCTGNSFISNAITIADIDLTTQNEFYITGTGAASACKEALVDVTWVISASSLRNTISANTLTKLTSGSNWDGNGFSFQSVSNNGYMQTTVAEINTERMIGLSATDVNSSFNAFFLQNGGGLRIYESGTDRGAFGTYASGNVLKIAVENNVVKYYRNGTVLFSSSVAPTLPLFVDVSNISIGATANNVKISNGSSGTYTAAGIALGEAPVFQWRLNGVNVGTNSSTYTNTSLSNNDVVNCRVTPDLGGCTSSSFTSNSITIAEPTNATTTWIGTTNAWNTASNWTNGVPTKYTTAVITSGTNNPVISTNAAVYSLTIGAGRTLTINNSSLSLEVYGNISNSGTFTPNNSTVILYGCSAPNTITSTLGISFFNLTVDNSFGVVLGGSSNVTATNSLNLINGVVTTGSNRLILSNSAASSLAYTNGFVFGNLRRNIASNTSVYFFPIANGSNTTDRHLAAIINNNLTGVTFINGSVVDFTQTSPNSDAFLNTRQGGFFLDRTIGETNGRTVIWDFTPSTAPTGGSYGVRLYAENTILSAADDNTFCPLKRNNTTSFVHFQTFDASTTIPSSGSPGRVFNFGNGFAQRTGYTSFSEFVIGKNSVEALPIELLSFDARCHTGKIELTWSTATEINNDYFTIERSYDGINYSIVGNVEGAGNSSEILHYSFWDQSSMEGTIYYRLKQTDYNGQFQYSDLMAIHCNQIKAEKILVYPNPASSYVTIELPGNDELLPYELINTEGQAVLSGMITGKVTLSANKVLPGMYFVKITTENGILREKLIIE